MGSIINLRSLIRKKKLIKTSSMIFLSFIVILFAFCFIKINYTSNFGKTTTTTKNIAVENDDPRNPDRTIQTLPSNVKEPNYVSAPPAPNR